MASEKKKSVADIIKEAQKKYDLKVGTISSLVEGVKSISTGNIAIDYLTGVGGIPLGRSTELYGAPSAGKTTCALQTASNLQKIIIAGGDPELGITVNDKILYVDYEQAMDAKYCSALGLDLDHESMLFMQPSTIEEGANTAKDFIESGEVRLMIWDSVAAAVPDAVAQKEIGGSVPAAAAKLYAVFTQTLNEPLKRNNCAAIFINHIAEMLEMGGGGRRPGMPARTTTPGGRALKFYSSVRIECTPAGQVKGAVVDALTKEEADVVVATNVRVKVTKNKVGPPHRTAIVRVAFGKGFDNYFTAMMILVAHKKIPYATGYFYFDKLPELIHEDMGESKTGRPFIRGQQEMLAFGERHPDWRELVIKSAEHLIFDNPDAIDAITPVDDSDDEELFDEEDDVLNEEPLKIVKSAEIDELFD